ncbi:MAG: alpha/beta hydrolase [Ignavibacteria bacterium]|nr:alpha/beta hydrolase [Ignavibacteria bacterium]
MRKYFVLLVLFQLNVFASETQFLGCWIGKIDIIQQVLAIKICFSLDSNSNYVGKIDIPQQNAFGLSLSNIEAKRDSIKFDLIVNVMNIAKFHGKLVNANTESAKIVGTFRQMGLVGKFEVEKSFANDEEPEEDTTICYEEEVEIHSGGVKLAGTFSRPIDLNKYPVVIFITGSGLQNRDEEIYGFKIFKKISDELIKIGIATLRMDDRGVGGSTTIPGTSPTTFDFANDVEQMINYLKTRKDIDTGKICLLGHSEGAIVAFIVGSRNPNIRCIISIAGPTIRGDSLILEQILLEMKNQNVPDSLIQETIQDQMEIYNIVRKTQDYERAKEILRKQAKKQLEFYPEEISSQVSNILIERNIQMQIESIRSEWFRTFIDINPIDFLSKIKCPTLLIFAEKDQQVPLESNISKFRKHIKKKNFTVAVIPNANHLFQKCKTGQVFEYGILPKKFAPNFIETISNWLRSNLQNKK